MFYVELLYTIGSLHVSILKLKCQNNLFGVAISSEKKKLVLSYNGRVWQRSKIVRGNVLEYLYLLMEIS